ncbi:MAG: cell division protein FtsQ/DivIB [Bacillota bacterium]
MSEKKSWDIRPSAPRSRPTPRTAPPERRAPSSPVRKPTSRDAARTRAVTRRSTVPLKQRRRLARRRLLIIGITLLVLFVAALIFLAWQPWLRVTSVHAEGPHGDEIASLVKSDLEGTRFFIIPRNSIFFLPEKSVRERILTAFPDVSAVSLGPESLNALRVRSVGRASVFWWCGTSYANALTTCYDTDSEGLVFGQATAVSTTTDTGVLRVYLPVADADASRETPVGAHVADPARIPGVLDFVKAVRTLGADVVAVELRSDEADLYTKAGTRITYVIGKEQEAAALAASSFPSLNLNDGSLSYVDLRFSGKAYFKKKGE